MKNIQITQVFTFVFLFVSSITGLKAQSYDVVSPNEKLKISIHVDNGTKYEVWQEQTELISSSEIALNLDDGRIIGAGTIKNTERNEVREELPVLIGKNKTLNDHYNELIIHYNEDYDLIVRAYNEGLAYRFVTNLEGEITVLSEDAVFNFTDSPKVHFPFSGTDMRNYGFVYLNYKSIKDIPDDKFSVSPILFEYQNSAHKVAITEADTYDYPGLYMERSGDNSMRGMWAKFPIVNDDNIAIERLNYIAKTEGTRSFPWRVIIVAEEDKELLNNELVYLLAEPCRLEDTSWIKPGKTSWEWWHKAMLTPNGAANVEKGIPANGNSNLNFNLYRYYVDFAAANNIEYLTLDAGWSDSYIKRLCDYAKPRNVKIIVWIWTSHVLREPEWLEKIKKWGVAGVKIDFFDRNDQEAMTWGHFFAEKLAEQELVGVFHGCPIPTGLNRTYPNILNFEAVNGNECNFWVKDCNPDYHVLFPFIRLLAGPTDFTPGSMRNKTQYSFSPVDLPNTVPSSMGTRAHELSMYVIFDQWLGFLCDAPTEYSKYPDILDFLSTVPTVWDKTVPLDSKLGEYISIAKQTGDDWYVGGMTGWTAKDIEVDFGFLSPDVTYSATILRDSTSSGNYPTRYVCENIPVTKDSKLTLKMARGGGFAMRLIANKETGIANVESNNSVSVLFEKQTNSLNIQSKESLQFIDVYTTSGEQIFSSRYEGNTYFQQINLPNLTQGVYVVKVATNTNTNTSKFIY